MLKVKSKKSKKGIPQEVSLTVVDTPGLGDTDGDEQDARNLVRNVSSHCSVNPVVK